MTTINNNINNIESIELEQMRQQFEMLKQHINEHQLIKEEQLKKAVNNDLTSKLKKNYFGLACASLAIILELGLVYQGKTTPTNIFSSCIIVCCIIALINEIRRIKRLLNTSKKNVVEAQTELANYYKQFTNTTKRSALGVIAGISAMIFLHFANGNSLDSLLQWNDNNILMLYIVGSVAIFFIVSSILIKNKAKNFIQQIKELDEYKNL